MKQSNYLDLRHSHFSKFMVGLFGFVLLMSGPLTPAAADKEVQGNKVNFSITETQTVNNDNISITFSRLEEAVSPEAVANKINQQMQAAVNVLKSYPDIVVQTSQYNIYPVYKKQVISHWRGQQSLILTLENKPGLVQILAKLQPYLAYNSMQFGVSERVQNQIKSKLIDQAIYNFRMQAERIAKGFNALNYRILETHINSNGASQPRPYVARAEMAMMADSVAPAMKAGQSKINVTISGTILLPY